FACCAQAKLINAFQLFRTEVETVQTLDLPQLGERQSEDHGIEVLRLCSARGIKAHHDLPALVIELRQRVAQLHLDLVLERVHQSLDKRARSTIDAVRFVAVAVN